MTKTLVEELREALQEAMEWNWLDADQPPLAVVDKCKAALRASAEPALCKCPEGFCADEMGGAFTGQPSQNCRKRGAVEPRACAGCGLPGKASCPHCDVVTCGDCATCEHYRGFVPRFGSAVKSNPPHDWKRDDEGDFR